MELTKKQIQRVEAYLDIKKINYIDVRLEILDHILIDIENLLLKGATFDDSLKKVIYKWNQILEDSASIFLGYAISKPRPIIRKMVHTIKYYTITMWVLWFVLLALVSFLTIKTPINEVGFYNALIMTGTLFYSGIILISYVVLRKSKVKTTYRFLFESQILPSVIFSFFTDNIINKNGTVENIKAMMLMYILLATLFGIKLLSKHISVVKNYSI